MKDNNRWTDPRNGKVYDELEWEDELSEEKFKASIDSTGVRVAESEK